MASIKRVIILGGGASGVFAAIHCAEASLKTRVTVIEKTATLLSKVRISGGGRCNVTHACFDPRELSGFYPRGGASLIGPFSRFQPQHTIAWFEARGVRLKTERDGRIFPISDSSQTIVDCLCGAARNAGVEFVLGKTIERCSRVPGGGFEVASSGGDSIQCDGIMVATGGCRSAQAAQPALSLGHSLVPPVPSLFAFHLDEPWLTGLSGVSLDCVNVSAMGVEATGPLLITHHGISGPAVLRVSAWGARQFHEANYKFQARVDWAGGANQEEITKRLTAMRSAHPARRIMNDPLHPLPSRLWEALVMKAGIDSSTRWAELSSTARHALVQQITGSRLGVVGKSLNKEEFVTCGGIPLNEVNFKTMESRICPGLYFGGEILDMDGLTGGFNFQAAWTTGWLAGNSMGQSGNTSVKR